VGLERQHIRMLIVDAARAVLCSSSAVERSAGASANCSIAQQFRSHFVRRAGIGTIKSAESRPPFVKMREAHPKKVDGGR
jgi:hypothetical protein